MADQTDGQEIMELLVKEIKKRLKEAPQELKAADFEFIRKLMADNSITLSQVAKGEFGEFAKRVSEEFPYQVDGPTFQ